MHSTSLAAALGERENDYRPVAAEFEARTGLPWHAPTPPTMDGSSLSVIVAAHNAAYCLPTALDALAAQATAAAVEVIVVDDHSADATARIAAEHPAVTRAVRLNRRAGAGAARNVGLRLAGGDTVVFMDADMVPLRHVLADFAARATDRLVLLGFRHNIGYAPDAHGRARVPAAPPDLYRDHRVRWRSSVGTPALHSGRTYQQPRVAWVLDRTADLVELGRGAAHEGWDLPLMVVTALMAAPRRAVLSVGCFATEFDAAGWGGEDTHLGARLIADGCLVAPLRQARAYHIDPPDSGAVWAAKMRTGPRRAALCRDLLRGPADVRSAERADRLAADLLATAQWLRT